MPIVFLVILVDLIGFGIMVPIFAFYPLNLGYSPALATLLMSLYVIAQFLTAPILGRLSDSYGRRPVLMLSMLGGTAGYLILANANSLWMIALARIISGAMAGNISAAQAYMTDISGPEDRAKAMGLIGAAFGIGFLIGPLIGGYLAGDSFANANLSLPAYVSAALAFTAFVLVALFLPESHPAEKRTPIKAKSEGRWQQLKRVSAGANVRMLLLCGLVFNVAAGLFESLFPIWVSDHGTNLVELQAQQFPIFGSGPQGLVPFLLLGGIVMVTIQGGLIGPLSRRFGERRLLKTAALFYIAGILGLVFAADWQSLLLSYLAMAIVSGAGAIIITSMQSLVSQQAEETERGIMMGIFSSASTVGRAVGTICTGMLFTYAFIHASYYAAALMALVVAAIASLLKRS